MDAEQILAIAAAPSASTATLMCFGDRGDSASALTSGVLMIAVGLVASDTEGACLYAYVSLATGRLAVMGTAQATAIAPSSQSP